MAKSKTIEVKGLLDFWKRMYNPDSKPIEFDGFRKQAGLNNYKIIVV